MMYCAAVRCRRHWVSSSLPFRAVDTIRTVQFQRTYQSFRPKKQDVAETHVYAPETTSERESRLFAVERVGGRECHVSWTKDGVTKEWRELALPVQNGDQGSVATTGTFTGRVTSWFRQMFLPINYPQSVHRSYLTFHALQFFESTFGTIVSVLCNQALLTSLGVSAEGSIFGAVAAQWIIKDGAGEIAKLFFIRSFSPYFDSHPKTFTLFGEIIVALGSGLQIATVLASPTPGNFLLCAAGGNMFKIIGHAIWFTTHMKWMRYFSLQGNMGDVAAKDESQTSLAQLVGYIAGIGLITLSHSPAYLYSLYFLFTPGHLLATVGMMRLATFETLTLPRLSVLAREYAARGDYGVNYEEQQQGVGEGDVPTLREMERRGATGMFGEFFKKKEDRYVDLAPRVADVVGRNGDSEPLLWKICTNVFRDEQYLLYPPLSANSPISVFFHPDASPDDTLRSILHAARLRHSLFYYYLDRAATAGPSSAWVETSTVLREALIETHQWTQEYFIKFKQTLEENGWRTDEIGFADHGNRLLWGSETDYQQC